VASPYGGRLGDRRGSLTVLVIGVAAFAIPMPRFAITGPSTVLLAMAFVNAAFGIGFVETAEHAAVATHTPEHIRGSAFGLLAATQSFGNLAASAIAGALWTLVSPEAAFIMLAGVMVVSLAGFGSARRPRAT
jgi:MFS family permease